MNFEACTSIFNIQILPTSPKIYRVESADLLLFAA